MKTTKHKWLSILLIAAIMLTVIAGCSSGDGSETATPPASEDAPEATQEETETPEATAAPTEAPVETPAPIAEGLPENIADLTIILDGDTVTMLMQIEDFLTLGWEPEEGMYERILNNEEDLIEPGGYEIMKLIKGDINLGLDLGNRLSDQPVVVRQTQITGIKMQFFSSEVSYELPLGIKRGVSTIDDVIAAYGEPSDIYEPSGFDGTVSTVLDYKKEGYRIKFWIETDSDIDTIGYCDIYSW